MHKVAILSYPGMAFFELACATELFMLPRPELANWYKTDFVSFADEVPYTSIGIGLQGAVKVRSLIRYHTVVVPSWSPGDKIIPEALASALLRAQQKGVRILSFCSGAFLLARLGMLNGRNATTHWCYAEQFQTEFPLVNYVGDVLYVYEDNVGTAAGSAAALDLGLAIIRDDYGSETANKVARRLVIAAHRNGGQSQFVEASVSLRPNLLTETLDWAVKHLRDIVGVDQLAQRACMSRRSFDRKFRACMNVSPQSWLIDRRVDLARQLLEKTGSNMLDIALNAGFETPETLRHHFRKRLGLSPSQYRENFNGRAL